MPHLALVLAIPLLLAACDRSLDPIPADPGTHVMIADGKLIPMTDVQTTTWTKAKSPYRVAGIVRVPKGATLTIEPGVDVVFERTWPDSGPSDRDWFRKFNDLTQTAAFRVEGTFVAMGSATDSIRFLRTGSLLGGLEFSNGAVGTLEYVRIADIVDGEFSTGRSSGIRVSGSGSTLTMDHSVLAGVGFHAEGVTVYHGSKIVMRSSAISHRWLEDFGVLHEQTTSIRAALYVHEAAAELTDCRISGGDEGVWIFPAGSITMRRCVVVGNGDWRGPRAIGTSDATGTIEDCVLTGGASFSGPLSVRNCTIVPDPSDSQVSRFIVDTGASVTNTIVWGIVKYYSVDSTASVSWSIVQRDPLPPGAGNRNVDPLFADPVRGDWRLMLESPAINAGDPESPKDPDGSRADIGARLWPCGTYIPSSYNPSDGPIYGPPVCFPYAGAFLTSP